MDYLQLAEKFVKEMHAKYMKRVNKPGNTPQPWYDFSKEQLLNRLFEEMDELREVVDERNDENIRDELLDVANFCMYLWGKLTLVKDIYDEGNDYVMLIAVEGIDGSGKTTISSYIAELLRQKGYKVKVFKEPGDSEYGKKIKNSEERLSPEEELEFFLKDREIDVKKNILPALQKGYVVVMDRYYLSNIAYQSARNIDAKLIREKNEKIAPKPDLTILLDVEPEIALERAKKRGKLSPFEKLDYLKKVRRCFLENIDETTVVVDASKPLEKVKEDVKRIIDSKFNQNLD